MKRLNDTVIQQTLQGYHEGDLSNVILDRKNMRTTYGVSSIVEIWFNWASLNLATFEVNTVQKSEFIKANLEKAKFISSKVSRTTFKNANLFEAEFNESSLSLINFRGADLRHAVFNRCALDQVDFRGANLSGLIMEGTSMSNCYFDTCWQFNGHIFYREDKEEEPVEPAANLQLASFVKF